MSNETRSGGKAQQERHGFLAGDDVASYRRRPSFLKGGSRCAGIGAARWPRPALQNAYDADNSLKCMTLSNLVYHAPLSAPAKSSSSSGHEHRRRSRTPEAQHEGHTRPGGFMDISLRNTSTQDIRIRCGSVSKTHYLNE